MSEIRILINFDPKTDNYKNYFPDDKFKVDTRTIASVGLENSADTLTEYDAVILSFENPIGYLHERARQIFNYLKQENKLFVFIINRYKEQNGFPNTLIIGNILEQIGIAPQDFINVHPSGSQFKVIEQCKDNIFFEYLKVGNGKWKMSFKNLDGNQVIPLAINTDGDIISFELKSDKILSSNIFMPWLEGREEIFWNIIKEHLISQHTCYSEVADWVNMYKFPQLVEIEKEIDDREIQIKKIVDEKKQFEIQKQSYERIRNTLLYLDGDLLHKVCKEVLQFLGIEAENGKQGREDLVFILSGDHYLVEVKGCENSASKKHIGQLRNHKVEYENENSVKTKCILLINAWRKFSLEERNTPDRLIFPNDVMNLVDSLSDVILMTTQQLFFAYCKKLSGEFDFVHFTKLLKDSVGLFPGYDNFSNYKVVTF